jgi:HAMP domain-containing protein
MVTVMTVGSVVISQSIKNKLSTNLIEQFYLQEELIARQTALTLENYVLNIVDELLIIAQLPELIDGTIEECNAKLEQILGMTQLKVGNLGRVNKEGIFKCSVNKALVGVDAKKLGDYIPKILNDLEHKPVISRAFVPPGTTSYVSAVHVPVYKADEFMGTMGGAIYFDELGEKILKDSKPSEKGAVVLVDDDGTILYHPIKQLVGKNIESEEIQKLNNYEHTFKGILDLALKGETGTVQYFFNGAEKIAAFTPVQILPDHVWMAIVTVPLSDIDDNLLGLGVKKFFNTLMSFEIGLILLTAFLFLWYMIAQFFNPISKITDAAKEVAKGNLDIRIPVARRDEIGMLARVFNEMLEKIKSYYANLELEVRNKTKELADRVIEVKKVDDKLLISNNALATKIKELEKINTFMIDRELKMTELKKENEQLKKKQ